MSSCSKHIVQLPEKKVQGAWSKAKVKKRVIPAYMLPEPPPPPPEPLPPSEPLPPRTPQVPATPLPPPPTPTPAQGQTPAQGLPLQVRRTRSNPPSSLSDASSSTSSRTTRRLRARTRSPSPETKELPPAGLVINPQEPPAQGSPAQGPIIKLEGQASSSSATWEPPDETHAIVMEGKTASARKAWRSQMRSEMNRAQRDTRFVRYVSNLEQAPPICNRVASEWHKPDIGCDCDKRGSFLHQNLNKTGLAVTILRCKDATGVESDAWVGRKVSFWRSDGGKGKKWWYNGKVESLQRVQFPSGKRAAVVGIN